jgi:purine-binding chemotaxis protein CheW
VSLSLSQLSAGPGNPTDEVQLVVFALAGCEIGVGIKQVREIIRVAEITMMPKAPKFLEGIINLRGRIIPVLDLKRRFAMPLIDRTEESRILVVERKDQGLGLLVDKVVGVLRISASLIEPPRDTVLNIGPEFIEGLLRTGQRLIVMLNLGRLLMFDEAKVLPEWETASHGEGKALDH